MLHLTVVAAALVDTLGQVLIAQRAPGKWAAGRWEFPGGKVEPDEAEEAALRRELREELGIEVDRCERLGAVRHRYPDREVDLALWLVPRFRGTPAGIEGQALRWLPAAALETADLLEADLPLLPLIRAALAP
jgi:8-oxo-dGTP diphosphatase